jgi:hypothetical protein
VPGAPNARLAAGGHAGSASVWRDPSRLPRARLPAARREPALAPAGCPLKPRFTPTTPTATSCVRSRAAVGNVALIASRSRLLSALGGPGRPRWSASGRSTTGAANPGVTLVESACLDPPARRAGYSPRRHLTVWPRPVARATRPHPTPAHRRWTSPDRLSQTIPVPLSGPGSRSSQPTITGRDSLC